MASFSPRVLGPGLLGTPVGPLGLGSGYGLPGAEVERAFERGVTFFLWSSPRKSDFGLGLRSLVQTQRTKMTIAVQSFTRAASLMEWSVDRALRALRTDYVDVLGLGWWNLMPPRRIIDAAIALREKGKVRHLMISCHRRPTFESILAHPAFDAVMLRYNAAHPGAEREVFPLLDPERRHGVVAFTATRWGTLLDPALVPQGERVPRASDCYRFALSHPSVDVCLAGPKDRRELDEALAAIELGPMDSEELAWIRRVGAAVRASTAGRRRTSLMDLLDRIATWNPCGPKKLALAP